MLLHTGSQPLATTWAEVNSVLHHTTLLVMISTMFRGHSEAVFLQVTCLAAIVTPDISSIVLA